MIVVELMGGLGNQLFQYATGLSLAKKNQCELRLDLSFFRKAVPGATPRRFCLNEYAIPEVPASWLVSQFMKLTSRRYEESSFGFHSEVLNLGQQTWLHGYFQSEQYFFEQKSDLRHRLRLRNPPSSDTQKMIEQMRRQPSVAIHVRRGDYLSNPLASQVHPVLSQEYYYKAVEHIEKQVGPCMKVVFSDDFAWARENLKFSGEVRFCDFNGEARDVEDLFLMSHADHFVIANSSFSWWGAWLGEKQNSKICAPLEWFKKTELSTKDLIPSRWMQI